METPSPLMAPPVSSRIGQATPPPRKSAFERRRAAFVVLIHRHEQASTKARDSVERTPTQMTTTAIATRLRRGVSRRAFLKTTAGTAALIGALKANFPAGVHIAQAAGPEVTKANLGFIALTDAGPLFVAKD